MRVACLLTVVLLGACTFKDPGNGVGPAATSQSAALTPPVVEAAPVAPPVATPVATPVVTPAAPPAPVVVTRAAPAQTVIVVQAPPKPVDTIAVCRQRFASECTGICNAKVNARTTDAQKRRIAHDICFGECTRAAFSRCH